MSWCHRELVSQRIREFLPDNVRLQVFGFNDEWAVRMMQQILIFDSSPETKVATVGETANYREAVLLNSLPLHIHSPSQTKELNDCGQQLCLSSQPISQHQVCCPQHKQEDINSLN